MKEWWKKFVYLFFQYIIYFFVFTNVSIIEKDVIYIYIVAYTYFNLPTLPRCFNAFLLGVPSGLNLSKPVDFNFIRDSCLRYIFSSDAKSYNLVTSFNSN